MQLTISSGSQTVLGGDLADTIWPDDITASGGEYVTETVRDLEGVLHTLLLPGEPLTLRIQGDAPRSISAREAQNLMQLYDSRGPFGVSTDYLMGGASSAQFVFASRPVFRAIDNDGERYSYDLTIRATE